jgi:3'-5' exoribonuclease
MEKIWVKDVKEGERLKTILLVARKAIPTAKSGKTYLAVAFQDKTGELDGRAFERVDELAALLEEKDYVEVEGQVGTFQGRPQLRIESVAKQDPAALDAAEFVWVAPPEPKKPERPASNEVEEGVWKELLGLVEAIVDPYLKALVKSFVEDDDVAGRLRRAAAAKTVHHAYPGGLLEHTVACLKLAHRFADQYPQVDRDLLAAGAFFHDLGKIRELSLERNAEYTDEGRLVGHHVMTAQWIHDRARRLGVPRELEHHVVHLVLAHHGKAEYGSPKEPMTLEALLTHYIDDIDSRINSWLNLMGREGGSRRWTDSNNVYEQPIWRGALPTVQAEKPAPPAELMTPVIYVPRDMPHAPSRKALRKARPARPETRQETRPAAAGEAKPAEGAEAPRAEATPAHAERPDRPPRPERRDRPDRGGGPRGFGDRKKGYMGPRLPGDRGPGSYRPSEKKSLTHNPFAALAAKLDESGKAPEPEEAGHEPEAAEAAAPEAPHAEAPPAEAVRAAEASSEPAPAPAEGGAEQKAGEGG